MTPRAVADSACLIALDAIGRLDLISGVFEQVSVTPEVLAEVGRALPGVVATPASDRGVVAALKTQLDEGEASVIALAMEIGDVLVVLDDKKARRVARQLGLKVTGTIGLLVRAKRLGLVDAIEPLLSALERAGFRMSRALRQEALRLAGEQH